MARFIILFAIFLLGKSVSGQTDPLQDGNKCFAQGNYPCAVDKYKVALTAQEENTRKIAGYNIQLAERCMDWVKRADSAYYIKNYAEAKRLYELVLSENSADQHAKKRLQVISNPTGLLSVTKNLVTSSSAGGEDVVNVTTDADSYNLDSVPTWCSIRRFPKYFTITIQENAANYGRTGYVYVSAGQKTEKITIRQEGKKAIYLIVSSDSIFFNAEGGISREIMVKTNASGYTIDLLPKWCLAQKYDSSFVLTCGSNYGSQPRRDWFYVSAGGKEVKVLVSQRGKQEAVNEKPILPTAPQQSLKSGCFNCPKTNGAWGLTAGYSQLIFGKYNNYDGFLFGMRAEPLFKWGFGLNTGLLLYSFQKRDLTEERKMQFEYYGVNMPLHLEYRLNFSKWFNLFAYAGPGFNLISDTDYENLDLPVTFEYGGGFRTGRVQFNIGQTSYMGDYRYSNQIGKDIRPFQNLTLTVAYMFLKRTQLRSANYPGF